MLDAKKPGKKRSRRVGGGADEILAKIYEEKSRYAQWIVEHTTPASNEDQRDRRKGPVPQKIQEAEGLGLFELPEDLKKKAESVGSGVKGGVRKGDRGDEFLKICERAGKPFGSTRMPTSGRDMRELQR